MRGFLYAEHRALCGRCNGERYISGEGINEEAEARALENGWRYNEERGWLCPHCVWWLRENDKPIHRRTTE